MPVCEFEHNIQLQLADSLGFPVPNTQFWITLTIVKDGPKVTIQVPVINFQTGPVSPDDPEYPIAYPYPGGYLYTSDGFLPKKLRPNDLIPRSVVVASNNGMSLPFSFLQPPPPLPTPPVGYVLQVTNAGALQVQCTGAFGNIIPAGPQTVMPCSITYVVKPKIKLGKNYIIDPGFTNTTQFTNPFAADDAIRDSHVNDAFGGVVAWAWTSNGNIADKTNGILNVFVAIGTSNSDGTLTVGTPIQLSDLGPGFMAWDTAVAINRNPTYKNNIVVSYGVINEAATPRTSATYRAVSFDGGKTWPINGPTNIQPTGTPTGTGFGDNRGVASDKFGNIWYSTTNSNDNSGNFINQPTFWVSTDGGDTYSIVYTVLPAPTAPDYYDYPQYCFGGDGLGNYGLNFTANFADFINGTGFYPVAGFIPITGLGSFGTPTFSPLTTFANNTIAAGITASADGRVWIQGSMIAEVMSYIQEAGVIFKSPGAIDQNYAGPWQYIMWNGRSLDWVISLQDSQPVVGYISNSIQSVVYDDTRQALYVLFSAQFPDYSQNARLYFIISRDNGQTWSNPIDISTTDFANRGFQSMALDPVTGNLVFGWYDGRNDKTFKSVQYFGAIITKCQLDKLVEKIPLSNPLYTLPPAITPVPPSVVASKSGVQGKLRKTRVKSFEKYLRIKP